MGKKVKKKAARNAQKEKKFPTSSPKTVSQEIIPTTETVVDGGSTIKEAKCPHIDKGINLEKVSSKMALRESLKCDECREGVVDRRAKKGKGKQGKKKGSGSKSESISIWVCLECGHFSCGGVGFPTMPQTHAARHAKQNRHPLAVKFTNPNLRWCFSCSTLIPVQILEENGKKKDALTEIVKLLKTQSSLEATADVEEVWFGSGSVISEIKSVNTLSSSLENKGGYIVRGLVNLGNTCFFNSVLQNLLAMVKLRDYFLKLEGPVGPLTVSLKKLFVETNPSTGVRNVINPRSFFGSVCAKAPQFRGYQQHDSHELLRCLLDGLCTEESGLQKQNPSSEEDNTVPKHAPTFVDTVFGGQISSTVSCLECGHASIVYEPYLDLSLPLPTKRSPSKRIASRLKKPKLPPKRQGKFWTKTRTSDSIPADSVQNIPTSGKSSTHTQSLETCAEREVAPSGDSAQPEPAVLAGLGDKSDIAPQKLVVSEGNGIKQITESTIKDSVISSDKFSQMDYVEPTTLSNVHEKATMDSSDFSSRLDYLEPTSASNDHAAATCLTDVSVSDGTGKKELVQDQEFLQHALEASEQVNSIGLEETLPLQDDYGSWLDYLGPGAADDHDMASHNEYPSVIQDSGNSDNVSWKEEPQLKVQDFEVLLLPYKEVTSTSDGNEAALSCVSGEQEPSDFDGFGGLFDEPEDTAGPTVNPVSNGAEESGLMAMNNSESDPDEVDNTDSPVSVEKCLAYFTTPELLTKSEHAWQCEQCSKALLEKRMRLKNKLQKPVLNGGENKIPSAPSDSGNEYVLPNGVRNLTDRSIERAVIGDSDENLVLHSGKGDGSQIASKFEEGKSMVNPANPKLPEHSNSVTTLSEHSGTGQDIDSCCINEPGDKCKNDRVKQRESKLLARQRDSDGNEDEEVDSKGVKVARDASKRILINRAPPILTIHLKRFSQDARGRLSKLNGHVDFRDTIDLKPYMDPSGCRDKETYKYRLIGVVEHLGTMRGGHYVAYVKGGAKGSTGVAAEDDKDCMWYHASDVYVREASLDEVLRCDAYILFYEQM